MHAQILHAALSPGHWEMLLRKAAEQLQHCWDVEQPKLHSGMQRSYLSCSWYRCWPHVKHALMQCSTLTAERPCCEEQLLCSCQDLAVLLHDLERMHVAQHMPWRSWRCNYGFPAHQCQSWISTSAKQSLPLSSIRQVSDPSSLALQISATI